MSTPPCRICGGETADPVSLNEIMFGTGERFEYLTCRSCDTLQIASIPPDIGRYYPSNYYSFAPLHVYDSSWRRQIKRLLLKAALRYPSTSAASFLRARAPWLLLIPNLHTGSAILDVGSGNGRLLNDLSEWGFTNLSGADPYIASEIRQASFTIYKAHLHELSETYDVVMMNHSLEHVPDPSKMLKEALNLLRPNGLLVVRIPLKGGYFWKEYNTAWVQLDPPRHFQLFTEAGFIKTAKSVGLTPKSIVYDAHEFSFWGSEAVRRGENLCNVKVASPDRMRDYRRKIEILNAKGESDQACFVLQSAEAATR